MGQRGNSHPGCKCLATRPRLSLLHHQRPSGRSYAPGWVEGGNLWSGLIIASLSSNYGQEERLPLSLNSSFLSLRTGILIRSQPFYKLPPIPASGLEEEMGVVGGAVEGSHVLSQ